MNDLQTVPGYKDRVGFEKSYELVKVLGNSCQLLEKVISFYGNTTTSITLYDCKANNVICQNACL